MESKTKYDFKYFLNLGIKDLNEINLNSKERNMFYSLHCLNLYLFKNVKSNIDLNKYHENNSNVNYEFILSCLMQGYLENFKESIYPTLFHEYNILVDEKIVTKGLPDFIKNITNDNDWIEYFFDKYPVLIDLFDKTVEFSLLFSKEILDRLSNDADILEKSFDIKLSELKSLEIFIGDKHNCNRGVLKLIFENKSIYYKPRSLDCEYRMNHLTGFLQSKGLKKSLYIPKIISRSDYGWMESVNYEELEKFDDVNDFYFNQGINLALFYAFSVSDLISDNLIVKGSMPCYFDLECVFQPDLNDNPNFRIYEKVSKSSKFIFNSVLKTNLLPQYSFITNDFQGFSNSGLSLVSSKIPTMVTKEKDGRFIRAQEEIEFETLNTHIPSFNNEKINPTPYVDIIINGFSYCYDFLKSNKYEIKEYIKLNLVDLKIRILHRPTFVYSKILNESYLPEYLHDFKKRNQLFDELENINNTYINNLPLVHSEIEQLKKQDIPLFYTLTNSNDVFSCNNEDISKKYFLTTGINEVLQKIDDFTENDKKRQIELIKLSFCIHDGYEIKENTYYGSKMKFNKLKNNLLNDILLKKEVSLNYNKILYNGFNSDGQYSNYGLIQTPSYTWGISSQKWGLFDGLDGLSFFYLNLFKVNKNIEALNIGKSHINLGIKQFIEYRDYYSKTIGFNKVSLFNYPISTFYVAEYYLQNGIEILDLNEDFYNILIEWIEDYYIDDFDFDLLSGGAGTIVYLLKLYDRVKEDRLLNLCKKIAFNIIQNAKIDTNDSLCWISKFGKTHTGLSHGSSGIAFSFFKLNSYINSEEIFSAALKALSFEREMFSLDKKYWYPFKLHEGNGISLIKTENHFWAYGSGGIALSRILISDFYEDKNIHEDLLIGLNNILEKGWLGNFNYSSGVYGNLDVLNEYANKTGDLELQSKINGIVNLIIKEKSENFDSWSCAPVGKNYNSNFEMIGFFTGITGISNTLLNILDYEKTVKLFR